MKTWLALGDSYTIGEGVPLHESYPYQTLQLLRAKGAEFHAPEIIAKTGWTSDELIAQVRQTKLLPAYDYVTLLIGVNNQYRGMSVEDYKTTFNWLAEKALQLGNKVAVISIPDWAVTPFANGRDLSAISKAIDAYNAVNREMSAEKGFHYVEITEAYRRYGMDAESLVSDQLHPSGKVYAEWSAKLVEFF